jgi:hypothetical protein
LLKAFGHAGLPSQSNKKVRLLLKSHYFASFYFLSSFFAGPNQPAVALMLWCIHQSNRTGVRQWTCAFWRTLSLMCTGSCSCLLGKAVSDTLQSSSGGRRCIILLKRFLHDWGKIFVFSNLCDCSECFERVKLILRRLSSSIFIHHRILVVCIFVFSLW